MSICGGSAPAARHSMDDSGAVHLIEAIISAAVLLAVLSFIQTMPAAVNLEDHSLDYMSEDVLNVFTFMSGTTGHPDFRLALSTSSGWNSTSAMLASDTRGLLPPDVSYLLETQYGSIGTPPPDGAMTYSLPFLAYCQDNGRIIQCRLVLWRV